LDFIFARFKEVLLSVLPITAIVLILNFTLTPMEPHMLGRFLVGTVLVATGLTVFLLGVDIGIIPIGHFLGNSIAKSNKIWIVAFSGVFLGFFISIAEPDLHVLAAQVNSVTSGLISKNSIVLVVSIGIAVMISAGLMRIVFSLSLYKILVFLYTLIFVLALFSSPEFLSVSFDASGATTGALTVPFVLALSAGISSLKKDSIASEEDSFGLVAIASTGAIISVLAMGIFTKTDKIAGVPVLRNTSQGPILHPFINALPEAAFEIFFALLPVLLIFLIFHKVASGMSGRKVRKIMTGMIFTFCGLVLFLTGVNAGFMEVGSFIGRSLAVLDTKIYLLVTGFILGLVTILAEPAVHVLTNQIEEVTSGYVRKKAVIFSLSIGVGFAVILSILRITIPEIQLWHYLLPGYAVSLAMSYFAPKLFVGIAFDSGGVASGPMTVTFILSFIRGVAEATSGSDILTDGFGVVSMVALTPLLALQILGFVFKMKSNKVGL